MDFWTWDICSSTRYSTSVHPGAGNTKEEDLDSRTLSSALVLWSVFAEYHMAKASHIRHRIGICMFCTEIEISFNASFFFFGMRELFVIIMHDFNVIRGHETAIRR